ncbi:hypothetical protein E1265_26895 [Streptomyces sp. 8K308]|uniref:DUF6531 domain-containing protein n=1 Tax=Streptomyces sp. 8K308 TaxID=2530388 RepID=UPI00104CBAD6|nr:DUF6531 domain-containing protein [Streptomyces sp. 8K308]TDC15319.1 hypothetical protein E1265_26895 [Streptomyces sp. 8K308]
MARPSDWSPVDMDRDPTPGNPDEVRALADSLQTFADDVGEALGRIRGMAEDRAVLDWAGLSAEAFRSEFDGVPGNLEKLQTSYDMAAQALQSYWPQLETAQGMADRALDRAIAAQADLSSAQAALSDAQDWVSRAGEEADRLEREGEREGVEPPSEAEVRAATRDATAANEAASSAQSRVDAAEEALAAARQLAQDAKEMREEAAGACADGIDAASDAGIQNRRWWEDAIHWVSENWDTIVEICKVVVAVLGIVVMIIGGPLAWVVLAAALVVLADTLYRYANGEASLWDVAFAALDCIPGMKGLTTLGGLARGMRSLASTGLRGLGRGALGLGRNLRQRGVQMFRRNACGDPVDVATGELLMSATDVELPGVLPLLIERHHISTYRGGRYFGRSWSSTLDQRLILDEYGAQLVTADGMLLLYPRPLPDEPVLPVEGPRWSMTWDGQPGGTIAVHQRESGRTLHFASMPGRPGAELPLVAITDRNGNRMELRYDEAGLPNALVHSGGYHVGITIRNARVTELRLLNDPEQPTLLRYGYDAAGLLSQVVNSSGLPLRFEYDEDGRLTRWEDRNGYWYSYEYDASGRCVFSTGTERALEYRYDYDAEANRTIATNSLGHATTYQFNDSYQLVAETDPLGHTTAREWDRYDNSLAIIDPLGNVTRYEHDEAGHVVAISRPDGNEIRCQYNDVGLPTEIVQPDGAVWRTSYDAAGNRTVQVDPAGNRTRYAYHAGGGLAAITDALGNTTRFRCDAAGLPVAIANPLGELTRYRRNAAGLPVEVTDPLGAKTTIEWSIDGKRLRRVDPLGAEELWEWDGEGNLLAHTDENGGRSEFTYGAFDLLTSRIQPDGARYLLKRDSELRLVHVTDPAGRTWDYTYDPAGHLVAESDFDDRVTRHEYDPAGRRVNRINAMGQSVSYAYDAMGRLTRKTTSDGDVITYSHDWAGRVIRASSPGVRLERTYDIAGNLLTETVNGRTLTTSYDPCRRMTSRVTPSGQVSELTYSALGQLETLTAAGRQVAFDYDAAGREVTRTMADLATPLVLDQVWDAAGRLAEQALSTVHGVAGGEEHRRTVHRRTYGYREDGYVRTLAEPEGTTRYDLDAVGRVTGVHAPFGNESYSYDAAGNQTHARWPATRLGTDDSAVGGREYSGSTVRRAGAVRYSYDDAGRVIERRKKRLSRGPESWRYTWDAEDRLAMCVTPDETSWRYVYDPFGRRVAKLRLGEDGAIVERVEFTWSGATLVEQVGYQGERETSVLTWDYRDLRPVAQSEWRDTVLDGEQREFDRRFFAIVTDLVGSPTHLIEETGAPAWTGRSSLWGSGPAISDGTTSIPLRLPGQYVDEETGWHYNYFRHYDPGVGRYVSQDPLGLLPGPNPYAYPHNPLTWTDLLGLAAHEGLIPYNSDALSHAAFEARVRAGIPPGRNVAAAQVDGLDRPVIGFSKGNGYHSENHILDQLADMGIDPSRITALYSERQPCDVCGPMLDDVLSPGTPVSWSVPWGTDQALRDASNEMLGQMISGARGF